MKRGHATSNLLLTKQVFFRESPAPHCIWKTQAAVRHAGREKLDARLYGNDAERGRA